MAVLAAVIPLAACQAVPVSPTTSMASQATAALPQTLNGVGYLVLNAPILNGSRDILIADMGKVIDAGAREIHLAINSPGGDVRAAQTIVDYMGRMHASSGVQFEVYNVGRVAGAAGYVFLAGQRRYANPNSSFVFNAAGVSSNVPISLERFDDFTSELHSYERVMLAALKARTQLTDSQANTYVHRTVLLSAYDAKRDGVIDAITPYTIPPGVRGTTISVRPGSTLARALRVPTPN